MKTKSVPAIVMLSAGFVACVAGICAHMEVADFMKMLLIVLIVFYLLGGVVKIVLDRNFAGMNDEETTDGTLPQEEEDPEAEENETASEETENADAKRTVIFRTWGLPMKTVDREKLWGEYQKNPSSALREKLITEYAPLVKVVAGRLSMYLGYNVEYEDLVSYGIFGLIDAIDKFDPGKDVKFETYASLRIRGSILDQIRKMDWIPRTVRQKQKRIEEAIKNIEARTGRAAADEEIAGEIGIAAAELNEWQSQLKVTNVVSLNEFVEQGGEPVMDARGNSHFAQPEDNIEEEELKKVLSETMDLLTEKERKVILLYYYEELTLKEISNILEVSESRVSQLHTKALLKMRKKMGSYMGILTE